MSQIIISTCGTSLLFYVANTKERNMLNRTANYQENDFSSEDKKVIDSLIQQVREKLAKLDIQGVKKASAELNGILTYYQDQLVQGNQDTHYLLVSDTYQSQSIGEIIQKWLIENKIENTHIHLVRNLSTNELNKFRLAMSELIEWCKDILTKPEHQNYRIIYNLTGGFKAVQGFLQTVGMFYANEVIYIFQGTNQLLTIPRLPIKLDGERVVGDNLMAFRQLDSYLTVTPEQAKNIPETLLLFLGNNQVKLSEWGRLIWQETNPIFYRRELLEPLNDHLVYSDKFRQNIAKLVDKQPDRVELVNKACDKLSHYIYNNTYNPESLDFKLIQGKPRPDSTHECCAWSDKDAKRLYGHWQNDQYTIDCLDKHLPY